MSPRKPIEKTPPLAEQVLKTAKNKPDQIKNETERVLELAKQKTRDMLEASFEYFKTQGTMPNDGTFPIGGNVFDAAENILQFLGANERELHGNRYTTEQRTLARMFFDELYTFTRAKRRDSETRNVLKEYLQTWHQLALTVSPCIVNYLPFEDRVVSAIRFSNIPELQATIAPNMVGELVYDLQYHLRNADELNAFFTRVMGRMNVQEQLAFVNYLTTVGGDALAQGWANETYENICQFLENLQHDRDQNPLIHYGAMHSANELENEIDQPTHGVVQFQGDRTIGKHAEHNTEQVHSTSTELGCFIKPDDASYAEETYTQIARDALATIDHSLTPQSVALVDVKRLTADRTPESISWQQTTMLLKALSSYRKSDPRFVQQIIDYVKTQKVTLPKTLNPADPKTITLLRDRMNEIREQGSYTPVHFDLFEAFEDKKNILPKGSASPIDAAALLQELHRPSMREAIEHELQVPLNDLYLREQVQLLAYLATSNLENVDRTFATTRQYGLDAARSFLSCEHGSHMGEAVNTIAENVNTPVAKAIFQKYAVLIDLARETTEAQFAHIISPTNDASVNRDQVAETLLARAKDLLTAFSKKPSNTDPERLLHSLDRYRADLLLFAAVFKTAFKGKQDVSFEELRGVSLERVSPAELDPHDADEMLEMAKENWTTSKYRTIAINGLQSKLDAQNNRTEFNVLKKDEQMLAFMRFDELPNGDLYAGSLNISPALRASAIGEAFLKTCIEEKGKDHTIHADFFPEIDAGMMYVDRLGWTITGTEEVTIDDTDTKARRCTIAWDGAMNANLSSRQPNVTKEYLMSHAESDAGHYRVKRFTFPNDMQPFLDAIDHGSRHGLVVSRYFADPGDPNTRYVVFEPVPSAASVKRAA